MDRYRYKPLNEALKEIRLLTLHPGSFDSPVVISLERVVHSKIWIPEYEALSYAWGDDRGKGFLICSHCCVLVSSVAGYFEEVMTIPMPWQAVCKFLGAMTDY